MIHKAKPLQLILFIIQAVFSIAVLVIMIRASFSIDKDARIWVVLFLCFIIFIWSFIPFYLSLTYIIEDWHKTVQFDEVNHQVIITKKGKVSTLKREEIIAAYQVMVDRFNTGSRIRFPWYKYAMIIKKERERIVITNLICKPEEVLSFLKIHYKTIYWNIPVIARSIGSEFLTTDEFKEQVAEFEENFRNYSKEQLQNVLRNPQTFTDYARKAASNLLEKLPK